MIKKLRMKLIAASMVSLLIVLLIIEGIIAMLNYNKIVTEADRILEILDENDGKLPKMDLYPKKDNDIPRRKSHQSSSEFPYESRYFSVLMDEDGEVISSDTGKITIVDSDAAIEYAQTIWEKGSKEGFIENYRYYVSETESDIRIIFLDCGRSLSTFSDFIITGITVSVIGLVSVFILMIFVSSYIVKPFSENYEKQKRFITDAGHELKTPLTIIDADTEVLEMDFGENEWIADIQTQTKRMADLTNNLILLSRMEEERKKELMIEFPLSDVVEETVGTFQSLIKTQNKTLKSNIKPLIVMKGDEKAIRQLVTILLDNAVKYSDEEGRIEVSLEKQKNRIRFSVFNTTEMISREHLEHLFDRFYRTDSSRNSQTGGYGLGLSIAAATVNAHKGKIVALTEDEKSLLIVVTFPA
ncbi:MAG: sensor histidine kinase [Lachnospiraceae bacterium]